MTISNNISAAQSGPHAADPARSAASLHSPGRTDEFGLTGPSNDPDPHTSAYRKDLADVSLAGRVIASHYAEPVERHLATQADLFEAPNAEAATLARLREGDLFMMLDDSLGWAWGYGGNERLVGYVRSDTLKP